MKMMTRYDKIAVLRAIMLGDFIISLPALYSLRRKYPKAEITLLARNWNVNFAKNRNLPFDRVIAIPESKGINDPPGFIENKKELETFFTAMQKEQFDIAIQLHGGGRNSNPFVQKLGAKLTIGTRTPDALKLDKWIPYIFYQHEVHRYLEVMSLIGVNPSMIEPKLDVMPLDLKEAHTVIDTKSKYIVIHPGASDPRRHWGAENFAYIADKLAQKGYTVVVTGIESEKKIVDAVISNMQEEAINLCGKLSLSGLIGVLSKAQVLIANDTGPIHVARAIGTPTVGIYWFYNLVNWGPITRTWHRTAHSYITLCPVCGYSYIKDEFTLNYQNKDCGHIESLVKDVPREEVLYHAVELLNLRTLFSVT